MDQEKEMEKTQVTDSAVLKDVFSATATENTSGKPEKVEVSSEAPNDAPSSDKPQEQPASVETPNQPSSEETSDNVHPSERTSSEKTLEQPSSENTPDTGKRDDQTPGDQTANQPPNTCDDKSGEDRQPLGDESSTKKTDINPALITQRAEEQKLTGEKSEEEQHSVTSEQDPNANDQVSSSQTGTPPEQLKSDVQEVPIVDEPSAQATKDQDSAASNSADSNDKTEKQTTKQNVKEIGESSGKVEDSADAEPLAEVTSKQPEANLDKLQKSPSMEDTIAKQQVPADHQPTVESIPNKEKDDMNKVQKEETLSNEKDAVQVESLVEKSPIEKSRVESKIETQDKTTEAGDEEQAATLEMQDGGKESLNAPVEEATNTPVEEIGATGKVDTEGPRLRFGKTTEDEKEPKEEIKEEGDPGAKEDFNNVKDQERKPKEEISDVFSDLQDSLNSPVVCGLVVFALLVFIVILRCLFSLNAICYTLLYYSVLIISGYPLTLYMVRNNLDRSVIRVVVGVLCLLFAVLFYKCRPTITWMTEISELL